MRRFCVARPALVAAVTMHVTVAGAQQARHVHEPGANAHGSAHADTSALPIREFLARARAETDRFRDQRVASQFGYRPIGPDSPGMGQHWVSLRLLLDQDLDAARPAFLTYANIAGRPTLTGVVYARSLLAGEALSYAPFVRDIWHEHSGALDDEGALLGRASAMEAIGAEGGARLAMLHVWLWSGNPDGIFAGNNWALPYMRATLVPPRSADPTLARALSLLDGGDTYYIESAHRLGALSPAERAAVERSVTQARTTVHDAVARARDGALSANDGRRIVDAWDRMWHDIEARLTPAARQRVRVLYLPVAAQ